MPRSRLPRDFIDPATQKPGGGVGAPDTFDGIPFGSCAFVAFGRDGNVYRRSVGLTIWVMIPSQSEWPRKYGATTTTQK